MRNLSLLLACCAAAGCSSEPLDPAPVDEKDPVLHYDREIHIPDLDGTVSAFYDDVGMLSLDCETDRDCLAAQGYFHAHDRFFQMDLRRRFALGTLSEVVGGITLETDHQQRIKLSTREGKPIAQQFLESLSPEMLAAFEAYSRGVNAWLEDLRQGKNGAMMSKEYAFLNIDVSLLSDWSPIDCIASFLPIVDRLTNDSPKDLLSGQAIAELGMPIGSDLYGVRVVSTSTVLPAPAAKAAVNPPQIRALLPWHAAITGARQVVGDAEAIVGQGSNNWAVAPTRARDGIGMMASDPHIPLSNPAIWYMVHLDAKTHGKGTLHLAGASYPGLPGVLLGHNDSISWSSTTTRWDQADVYLETLNPTGDAVVFNQAEVPLVAVDQTYAVRGSEPVTRTIHYVPHHGPVLSLDTEAQTATTLRWVAQDADTDFNFMWKLWTAETRAEAKEAFREVTTAGQNFTVIDQAGEIGWYPYNRLPDRPWMAATPSWFPLPGDGSAEWGAYLPYEELPQTENPLAGHFATANNDMTGHLYDGDPSNDGQRAIQNHAWAGFRHERISQLLAAEASLDMEDMLTILHDTKSLFGEKVVPQVLADLAGASLDPTSQKLVSALQAWDFFCPSGYDNHDPASPEASTDPAVIASSRGCLAFHVLWPRLKQAAFGDELAAAGSTLKLKDDPLAIAFLRPEVMAQDYWDDVSTTGTTESRADIVARAVIEAAQYLDTTLGSDEEAWHWGALHQLVMPADLFDAAGIVEFNHGPFLTSGGLGTVNWAPPKDDAADDYRHDLGPSFRLACAVGDTIACRYELPGGQRHIRSDPRYMALLDDWLDGRPRELVFDRDRAVATAAETIAAR